MKDFRDPVFIHVLAALYQRSPTEQYPDLVQRHRPASRSGVRPSLWARGSI